MSRKKHPGQDPETYDGLLEQVTNYAERRERWAYEGNTSLPLDEGVLAIVVSNGRASPGEYPLFEDEAARLMQIRKASGKYGGVIIVREVTHEVMDQLIADVKVAAIEVVAHGRFNLAWMSGMAKGRREYTWLDVARAATHLKWEFMQDMCGHFAVADAIIPALGIMAVNDVSQLRAAVGNRIPIPDGNSRDHLFKAPYITGLDLVQQILEVSSIHRGIVHEVDELGRIIRTENNLSRSAR